MKMTLALVALLTTTVSFAQKHNKSALQTTTTTTTQATTTTYTSSNNNELTANVGFVQSAVNLGVTYAKMSGSSGLGGYFQLQTEKDKVVYQALSLGVLYKMNLIETSKSVFYAAPGFGLAMVKVPTTDLLTLTTKTDDRTVFGPSLKIGAQLKLSPTFALGIERGIITNWFEEKAGDSYELTTVAMSFTY